MNISNRLSSLQRARIGYAVLLLVCSVFVVRLFYIQVIKHDQYSKSALVKQLKEYEIPAERGTIAAHNGDQVVPIVLNEIKYTVFADPQYVEDVDAAAHKLAEVLGGSADDYQEPLRRETRYAIVAKKQNEDVRDKIQALELKGVGVREAVYRTYPQGTLAAQLLGFVNDEGQGRYGVEEALQDKLQGQPGLVKAITDAQGVPLAANKDNTLVEAQSGKKTVLTIDIGMQQQLEGLVKEGVKAAKATSGGAIIMEVATGKVKAIANYPTYNPGKFNEVAADKVGVFENRIVSSPLEIGSIMKPLTAAAALDQGVVNLNSSYYDSFSFTIDGEVVTNVAESGSPGVKNLQDILRQSLNTGASWLLMQMGGGEINQKAREAWFSYMTDHYQFGKKTNIAQGFESAGYIPDPNDGFGLNIQYANTAFGQGMTATPLQVAAAYSAVLNGGTYHQPQLVEYFESGNDKEYVEQVVVRENVVSDAVSEQVVDLMEHVFTNNHTFYGFPALRPEFRIGGKTGTAQVPNPAGGYYEDRYNGTFAGFVGGDSPEYVIIVRVDDPKIAGFAGSKAAAPLFSNIATMLIDNFGVAPRTQQ